MARRSLQASKLVINKARKAFKLKNWTQEYLACEIGIQTRQPVWKFFAGRPVERKIFMEICFQLGLDWQEIAEGPLIVEEQEQDSCDINALVQELRSRRYDKIQAQCSTVRLLDIAQPIELNDIYVGVEILEALPNQNCIDFSNIQAFSPQEFTSFDWGQTSHKRVPALKAVATCSKLMIFGGPGSGKTTFLQHLVMQCNQGRLLLERVPIFIRLRNLVEETSKVESLGLSTYIHQELHRSNILDQQVEALLRHGKALIVLDGLDEVQEEERSKVLQQIRKLSEEYYTNQFIITCRTGAHHCQLEGFTDVKIANFDQTEIEVFVKKWFVSVGRNSRQKGLAIAAQFIQQLQLSENRRIRELTTTPLLLHMACSVFQAKEEFPTKQSDFYKIGLDILLVRWDKARGIKRDAIYPQLSLPHKIKLLSQIATVMLAQNRYFFEKSLLQQYIADYLRTLPAASSDFEVLQMDGETVLKSIEVQHGLLVERAQGIYSFSHLAFQEYLTARNVVNSFDLQSLNKSLTLLLGRMSETPRHEVLLLTASMLGNDDTLLQLIQQHVDELVTNNEKLQQFLTWRYQQSLSVQVPYNSAGTSYL